ncbi:MAG: hypothetical protein PHZ28_06725, partial [Candidatus Izemoplasmatales bacterium]|nr:hypothetical protein [Candidatus Izemoplasmatales bacterium]
MANNLEGFDTAGHISNIYFIKNSFYPWPDGWNHYFLSGYPQGLLYPSFFHWLAAVLSFVFSLEIALKIITTLAILGFVVIFYLLALKILEKKKAAELSLVIVSFFYFLEIGLSGNMFSDIFFGMVPHLFSLMLFITYIYFLYRSLKEKGGFFLSGVLLALNILTHIITGGAALLLAIIVLGLSFGEKFFKNITAHLLLGIFLSAYWWLPFLLNLNYISGSSGYDPKIPLVIVIVPFIILISTLNLIKFRKNNNIFIAALAIFNIAIILFYFIGYFFPSDRLPIHFYRFLVYPFILFPLNLVYLLKDVKLAWVKTNLIALFFLIYFFFFFRIIPVGPFPVKLLDGAKNVYNSGRVIATGYSKNMDARFHSTRMKIVEDYGLPMVEGLFMESSANGRFIMSLLGSWSENNENFVWGYKDLDKVIDLKWGAKIFGVNYEYNISDNSPLDDRNNFLIYSEIKKLSDLKISTKESIFNTNRIAFKIDRRVLLDDSKVVNLLGGSDSAFYYQTFYQVADNYLAEALHIPPHSIDSGWSANTLKWWKTDWLKNDNVDVYEKPILIWQTDVSNWNLADREIGLDLDFHSENKRMDFFTV